MQRRGLGGYGKAVLARLGRIPRRRHHRRVAVRAIGYPENARPGNLRAHMRVWNKARFRGTLFDRAVRLNPNLALLVAQCGKRTLHRQPILSAAVGSRSGTGAFDPYFRFWKIVTGAYT